MPNGIETQNVPELKQSGCGCLLRLFWIFGGMLVEIMVALVILTNRLPWFGLADMIFAGIAALTCIARVIEGLCYGGLTAYGRKTTARDIALFIALFVVGSAALLTVAHLAGAAMPQ